MRCRRSSAHWPRRTGWCPVADRYVRHYGRVYRWRNERGLRLETVLEVPEGAKVVDVLPWLPSPCARWNAEYAMQKLGRDDVAIGGSRA